MFKLREWLNINKVQNRTYVIVNITKLGVSVFIFIGKSLFKKLYQFILPPAMYTYAHVLASLPVSNVKL